ncbi:MAG: O-antigen ligase family protein [Fuerstia sp.]|nr:O-antigen ligase family protein [Fuerstiella sp.]
MAVFPGSRSVLIDGRVAVIGLAFLCAGMIAIGAMIEQQPLIAAAALVVIPAALIVLFRPELAVPVVLFVMYSNAAIVAVRFHGAPPFIAMLVPAPLLIPFIYNIMVLRQPLIVTPVLPWILVFVGWQLVCALLSVDSVKSVSGVLSTVLEGLLFYVLITNVVRSPGSMRLGVWALMAAGAVMGGVSVCQQATRSFDSNFGGFGQVSEWDGFEVAEGHGVVRQRRLCGPIGEQNRYAQIMLMLIPLALARFLTERANSLRLLALAAAVLTALGCGLTFSRSGAIAFVLMLLVGLAVRFVSRRQVMAVFLGGLLLLLAVPQYRTRLATVPSALGIFGSSVGAEEPDGAILGRATEMLAAARMAIDNPVFGVGPEMSGSFTRQYGQIGGLRALEGDRETHCLFLEVAAESGLPGILLFLGMLAASVLSLLRIRQQVVGRDRELEQTVSGFLLALTGYLAMGIFLHMSYIRYFWLMLAMADACYGVALSSAAQAQDRRAEEAVV